jgi:hypothetical protein
MTASLAFLLGCSSIPTQVNEGTLRAKTFSFMKFKGKGDAPSYSENLVKAHKAIQAAITEQMESRGVERVEDGGDLTVGYMFIVASNLMTVAVDDYYGYGEDRDALLKKASKRAKEHREEDAVSRVREIYRAGALFVDVLDSKTHELMYRNYASRELLTDASSNVQEERVRKVVEEALADLRVKPPR